jgi:hypothetical protein
VTAKSPPRPCVGYLLANAWQTSAGVGAWEQLSPHSLRHSAITFADPDLPVERTMRPGRSTYRPSVSLEQMRRIMADRDLDRLVGHDLRRQAR